MIRKLVRQMLTAQTLSALTVSLCLLIDNIMIGRFLGEEAIAAYGLANPILLITGAIGSMLAAGVQVACSRSLGSGSQEETNQGYSSAIAITLGISLILTVLVHLFRHPLATAMGAGSSGTLFEQTSDYLAGFVIGAPGSIGALILVPFLQMAGQSNLLIVAVLSMTVADIAFDLLSVLVFNGGMFGMGFASSLSYYVALAIAMIYFLSRKCVFSFSWKRITLAKIRELITGGVPSVFNMASSVVLVFILNQTLLALGDSAGVAAYTVLMTIGNASNCISTGIGGVSLTLSGILYNEEDRTGLKDLLSTLSKYAVILGAVAGVFLMIAAPLLVGIFLPNPGPAQSMAVQGLRLFALGLIPCCLNNALKSLYQGTDRVMMTEIISVLEGAVLPALAAFIFSRFMGTTGVWLYFVAGEILTLLGIFLWCSRKEGSSQPFLTRMLYLDKSFGVQPQDLLEMDIHTMKDVADASAAVESFCMKHGQNERISNHIALCVEEMARNVVEYGFTDTGEEHLSIRVQHKGDRWVLRFRDDCSAFDPVNYVPRSKDEGGLGIRLVMSMADDIRYTYSLNLNNLTIKFLTNSQ